jgi:hypothetical protein
MSHYVILVVQLFALRGKFGVEKGCECACLLLLADMSLTLCLKGMGLRVSTDGLCV